MNSVPDLGCRYHAIMFKSLCLQALPKGEETDFILVSCAGVVSPGVDPLQMESVTAAKRQGEASLRTSGLAYTIVRPGPIIDEPGGYKALVFDQARPLFIFPP